MSVRFNGQAGLILVTAQIWGPSGDTYAQLALDTGASATVINQGKLVSVGYDPAAAPNRVQIITGSGREMAPCVVLDRIEVLGQTRARLPIVCHTLPSSAVIDGLLGLDFLRGQSLTIDFRNGLLTLT